MRLNIKFLILIISTFYFTGPILCQDDSDVKRNMIKLSLFSYFNNCKIQYERNNIRDSYGITASYYYLNPTTGLKLEPFYRYYIKPTAPFGLFIEASVGGGAFNTNETYSKIQKTYDPYMNLIDETVIDPTIKKELFIYSYGGSLRFGYQSYLGTFERVSAEVSVGLQYFIYNIEKKNEQKSYTDLNGNTIVIETKYGSSTDYTTENNLYWYIFGPGSVFSPHIKIGYIF